MKELEVPPDPHLLESMRAVGYTVETAVADVVDNSITAGAKTIHVLTSASGPAKLSVFDDGVGMDRNTALDAMRLAARSPSESRKPSDLGRFGLGLKTASLSQARKLTLASKRDGAVVAFRWDLDRVIDSGRWMLEELTEEQTSALFGWNLLSECKNGTLVCWEDLDLLSMTEGASQTDFDAAVSRVRAHCELVFHRFVSGSDAPKICITFNGDELSELDPFLRHHKATQCQQETLRAAGATLEVQAFTLPFINKLSAADKRLALAPGSFRESQGFYIYRAGRLVIWGTWFRLNTKGEFGKLARVQVDVPNSLDHLWALDIKKSSATPPREIREALRQLAGKLILPSKRVQMYRGRKEPAGNELTRAWRLVQDREHFRYEVNNEHPQVQQLFDQLGTAEQAQLGDLLALLEQTFPTMDAHNRLSQDGVSDQELPDLHDAVLRARRLHETFADEYPTIDQFLDFVLDLEPYCTLDGFRSAYKKVVTTK